MPRLPLTVQSIAILQAYLFNQYEIQRTNCKRYWLYLLIGFSKLFDLLGKLSRSIIYQCCNPYYKGFLIGVQVLCIGSSIKIGYIECLCPKPCIPSGHFTPVRRRVHKKDSVHRIFNKGRCCRSDGKSVQCSVRRRVQNKDCLLDLQHTPFLKIRWKEWPVRRRIQNKDNIHPTFNDRCWRFDCKSVQLEERFWANTPSIGSSTKSVVEDSMERVSN